MANTDRSPIHTLKATHDSARPDGYAGGWEPGTISPTAETASHALIANRIRDLVRNGGLARTIVDIQTNAITQPSPSIMIQADDSSDVNEKKAKRIRDELYEVFESTDLDHEGLRSPSGLFSAIAEETVIAGGCLLLRIWDKGARLGFCVKLIEQSFIARDKNEKSKTGGWIVEGREYDRKDRLVAYHLYSTYENDPLFRKRKIRRYEAKDIIHYYVPPRLGSRLGISWFSHIVPDIRLSEDIKYSSQMRQRNSQAITAFVTPPPSARQNTSKQLDDEVDAESKDLDERGFAKTTRASGELRRTAFTDSYAGKLAELHPGSFYILAPGEEIKFAEAPKPFDFQSLYRPILQIMARASGTSYESLSGDYSNSSYSAARMAENQHRVWTTRHRTLFKDVVLSNLWRWISEGLELKGKSMNGLWHRWQQPDQVTAHPMEDAEIMEMLVENGVSTRSEWIRKRGGDPDAIFEEAAREQKRMRELGITIKEKSGSKPVPNNDSISKNGSSQSKHDLRAAQLQ